MLTIWTLNYPINKNKYFLNNMLIEDYPSQNTSSLWQGPIIYRSDELNEAFKRKDKEWK